MKLEYLPVEGDDSYCMYAFYDENKNEVIWNGVTNYMDHVAGTEMAQFTVCRRGKVVIVEACGWYSPDFHYRFELTELPDRVVILAAEAANLLDRAWDDETPVSRGE
ncbi:MAG: hypothetical protein Unbinned200contig1000_71 [Prokaryotic dsDNA virus sp.]|jgi:hypothetical protein|nr:MAG: hypothetical protein Unbinned200contig1000_71 [Prokaryotic dsDNA virus sp.]|tara:strand:+ start:8267 stop:8587 length:321 start_codon:yes stop_codon:yes gene_type:complete